MEDVFGKKLEAKIEKMLDRKIQEYMEKKRNENQTNMVSRRSRQAKEFDERA